MHLMPTVFDPQLLTGEILYTVVDKYLYFGGKIFPQCAPAGQRPKAPRPKATTW